MSSPSADLQAARRLLGAGDLATALRECQRVLAVEPDDAQAWHVAGRIHRLQNSLKDAIEAFRRAAASNPADGENHFQLAEAFWAAGDAAGAETSLRQAIACQADQPLWLATLGSVLNAQRKFEEARLELSRAIELKPGSA